MISIRKNTNDTEMIGWWFDEPLGRRPPHRCFSQNDRILYRLIICNYYLEYSLWRDDLHFQYIQTDRLFLKY